MISPFATNLNNADGRLRNPYEDDEEISPNENSLPSMQPKQEQLTVDPSGMGALELEASMSEIQEAVDEITATEGMNVSPTAQKLIDAMKRLKAGEDLEAVSKEIMPGGQQ
jgi:hypothetical protein